MKKSIRAISVFLVLAMVLCLMPQRTFAAIEQTNLDRMSMREYSQTAGAQNIYHSLNADARRIFDQQLAEDIWHEEHKIGFRSVASLASLNLPAPVLYSLNALMAGFAAAAADGPLPFGDAVLVVSAVAAVGVLALYWPQVAPKWGQIVSVFKAKFNNAVDTVTKIFNQISGQAKAQNKEIEDAKSRIPSHLKDKNGNVDLGKFNKPVKGRKAYKDKTGWEIDKDTAGHKGSWKVKNPKGKRVATVDDTGRVVGK